MKNKRENMPQKISVLGVPCYLGLGDRRGDANGGPEAILNAGLIEALSLSGYDVSYRDVKATSEHPEIFDSHKDPKGKIQYGKNIADVIALLHARAYSSLLTGGKVLALGGDHSIVPGTIGSALAYAELKQKTLGLVWIDAHADVHTDTTSHSHHANGMPLGIALGRGSRKLRAPIGFRKVLPQNVLHIGLGTDDCEPEELAAFEELHITSFSQERLARGGFAPCLHALRDLAGRVDYLWVSFDLDAVNRKYAPGVSFINNTGLAPKNVLSCADEVARSGKLLGADIVEYNRVNEKFDKAGNAKTATLAVTFAQRLFHQQK